MRVWGHSPVVSKGTNVMSRPVVQVACPDRLRFINSACHCGQPTAHHRFELALPTHWINLEQGAPNQR